MSDSQSIASKRSRKERASPGAAGRHRAEDEHDVAGRRRARPWRAPTRRDPAVGVRRHAHLALARPDPVPHRVDLRRPAARGRADPHQAEAGIGARPPPPPTRPSPSVERSSTTMMRQPRPGSRPAQRREGPRERRGLVVRRARSGRRWASARRADARPVPRGGRRPHPGHQQQQAQVRHDEREHEAARSAVGHPDAATLPRPRPDANRRRRPAGRRANLVRRARRLPHPPAVGPLRSLLVLAGGAAGAEVVFADPDAVVARLGDPRVAAAPAIAFRLAIAAALALEDTDLIVVPRLNPGDGGGPGAQDPWVADLPTMLGAASRACRRSGPSTPTSRSGRRDERGDVPAPADERRRARCGAPGRSTAPRRGRRGGRRRGGVRPPARRPSPWSVSRGGSRPPRCASRTRPGERPLGAVRARPGRAPGGGRRLDPPWSTPMPRRWARCAASRVRRGSTPCGMLVDGGLGQRRLACAAAEALAPQRLEVVDVRDLGEPALVAALLLTPA
jgi:hypothetical protein